jgi:benzoylformate decarboxylase
MQAAHQTSSAAGFMPSIGRGPALATRGNTFMNVRDAFYEILRAHGITTVFGNPGSNELPLLQDFPDDFRYILALQEGAVIGMADGFAQATGKPALVNVHAAAGTGNAMGNLINTQAGHAPVIITSGQQARKYTELNAYLTNVDAIKLAEPLVKWSHEPARPQDVPQSLSKGILLATAAPTGPVYLSLPLDDWDHEADASALGHLKSRTTDGNPVVPEEALGKLRERLASAQNPVMVAGPYIYTPTGWDGAVRLAEKLSLPVLVAPSPARCPFPTRHRNFQGVLPASIPSVASHFDGHDLIVAFGAPIFTYHEFEDGDYLPQGAELWAVTSDPDEAARAPAGHILIGDPAEAIQRLADTIPGAGRPPLPAREPLPEADTTGPAFTLEAILDAVNAAKTDSTVFAHEWTSTMAAAWDRLDLTRPGSLYLSAGGGLGWGLPAAIGLQLGDPSRRVVALLGDGTVHYSVSGLWTAAQHNIPVVFVVARNSEYRALKEFSRFMRAPDAPGMELPDMDIPGIAASYGVQSQRVTTLSDLTRAVKDALSSDRPHLIEISERRLADS